MPNVLLTAYGPYDEWSENASWLALQGLARDLRPGPTLTTRLYPVDFDQLQQHLMADIRGQFDYALHLGQAPGYASVTLEAVGINVAQDRHQSADEAGPLIDGGPVAFRTALPLSDWAAGLREQGIPARVSHHAGTYLCNAALYLSHYFAQQLELPTKSAFIHLPLDLSQAIKAPGDLPAMPVETSVAALRWILAQLV